MVKQAWQRLGLRLGPTARLYSHDESSVTFNYRVEHTDPELPSSVLTAPAADLECVRCHLNFHVKVPGLVSDVQEYGPGRQPRGRERKRKRQSSTNTSTRRRGSQSGRMMVKITRNGYNGVTAKRENSATRSSFLAGFVPSSRDDITVKLEQSPVRHSDHGPTTLGHQDPSLEVMAHMVSNHPELETIVRTSLDHMLLGSKSRGAHVSGGLTRKALVKVAPAVFDTNRLRVLPHLTFLAGYPTNISKGVAVRMPLIDGPSSAISYFAANAASASLRRKMQTLDVASGPSTDGPETPIRLVESKLRQLVCADSKPVMSPRGSQTSENNDVMPPFLAQESSHMRVFSKLEVGEEVLLPGEWPLNQVSSPCAEDVVGGFNQEVMPPPVENCTTERVHHPGMAGPSRFHMDAGRTMETMEMPNTAYLRKYGDVSGYYKEYNDHMLLEGPGFNDMGEDSHPSPNSLASASRWAHAQADIPGYFKEYHDRLLFKPGRFHNMGEASYPSPSPGGSASRRMYGGVLGCEDGDLEDNFT